MVIDFYSQIAHNKKMTYVLFLMFFVLISILSYVISLVIDLSMGGGFYFIFSIFGILSILFAIFAYYKSDSIVTKVSGAKEADSKEYLKIYNIVEGLCLASGLPKPRLFIFKDTAIKSQLLHLFLSLILPPLVDCCLKFDRNTTTYGKDFITLTEYRFIG